MCLPERGVAESKDLLLSDALSNSHQDRQGRVDMIDASR